MLLPSLQLGIVVDTASQGAMLRQLVIDSGHQVTRTFLASQFNTASGGDTVVDAWMINTPSEGSGYPLLESWLAGLNKPVIVGDLEDTGLLPEEFALWKKRMREKLHRLQGSINLQSHPDGAASFIWVLGGSTGGPEAVRAFLSALPAGLDVGFVYVQHIDPGYERTLIDLVNKNSHYPACAVTHGGVLPPNSTAIIASEHWVEVLENGTLAARNKAWPGAYSPSINQVFADVASSFGSRCGAIVFSGMADDGAAGARLIHQQGGQVWVQSPRTCAVSSMPDEALNTGAVNVVASPEGLAARLVEFMRHEVRGSCESR